MVSNRSENSVLDSLSTGVIVIENGDNIVFMNNAAEEVLGVSSEHLLNKSIQLCFSPVDGAPPSLLEALREHLYFTKRRARWRLHSNRTINLDYTLTPSQEGNHTTIEMHPLDRLLRISREEAWIFLPGDLS